MNAISFLIDEHNKIKKTFKDICKAPQDSIKQRRFIALCLDLIRHETMEQKIWYSYLKNDEKLKKIIKHLISEEKSAEKTIKKFQKIKTQKEWEKKFLAFKKEVEHHASEEETKLFPNVKKILNEKQLKIIGIAMRQFKSEFNKLLR